MTRHLAPHTQLAIHERYTQRGPTPKYTEKFYGPGKSRDECSREGSRFERETSVKAHTVSF